MSQRFTMKFKTGPLAGQTYSVGPGEYYFIGSAETCAIRIIDDPTVSPTHACIFHDTNGSIRFKDMGSQFGTFRNGKKLSKPVDLKPGDRITIGQTATFQSSWWNALQTTRLTKFSMVRANVGRGLSKAGEQGKVGILSTLLLGIVLSVGLVFYLDREIDTNNPVAEESLNKSSAESKKTSGDLGIFSGSLSAKLFGSKPKRAARKNLELTGESQFIWDEIVAISRRFGDPPPTAMDPRFVKEVEKYIRRFTKGNGHKILIERKAQYWGVIEQTLSKKGLPIELGYIVWVESNFKPDAISPVGALGPWQFMPETGKEYGLKIGGANDERKDVEKSTAAAADYFADLLRMFGTERYLLAVASYNTGQNRVKRHQIASTVSKEKVSDFWNIRFVLPKETVEYVPKFMAAIIIGRNPERWDVGH